MKKILLIFFFLPNFLFSQGYCADNFSLRTFNNFEINFMRGKTNYTIKFFGNTDISKAYFYKENILKESSKSTVFENDTLIFSEFKYLITFYPTVKIFSTFFKNKPIRCKLISHNLDDIISLPSNFKSCIDKEVLSKMNLWKIKGEFEKTVDFKQRTTNYNVNLTEIKFRKDIEQKYIYESVNKFNFNNLSLGKYDADNEFFKIDVSALNSFNLPVPIENAPLFKKNFNSKNFFDLELIFDDYIFEISSVKYKSKDNVFIFNRFVDNLNIDDSNNVKLVPEDICISGDCLNGDGSFVWISGSSYTGNWLDGEMSGFGTYLWSTGKKYVGEWLNGKMNGKGVFTQENGKVIEGNWLNGELVKN